jgi:hypothetical protein
VSVLVCACHGYVVGGMAANGCHGCVVGVVTVLCVCHGHVVGWHDCEWVSRLRRGCRDCVVCACVMVT